jgi:predicted nucleotidyltransferase
MRVNLLNKAEVQQIINEQKPYLSDAFSVEKIGLFGSFARNENTETSDIDLLVEFNKPVGLKFIELKEYLESVFNKPVDLVTVNALKPFMKDQVMNEVQFQ